MNLDRLQSTATRYGLWVEPDGDGAKLGVTANLDPFDVGWRLGAAATLLQLAGYRTTISGHGCLSVLTVREGELR